MEVNTFPLALMLFRLQLLYGFMGTWEDHPDKGHNLCGSWRKNDKLNGHRAYLLRLVRLGWSEVTMHDTRHFNTAS